MKKILYFFSMAIALGIGVKSFMEIGITSNADSPTTASENTTLQTKPVGGKVTSALGSAKENSGSPLSKMSQIIADNEVQIRLATIQQRRPQLHVNMEDLIKVIQRPDAWSSTEKPSENLRLRSDEIKDGREFILLDSLKIESLLPGDQLELPLQQEGKIYLAKIDEVIKHNPDAISWYGHIDGADGQTYSVSITRGKEITLGGIDTPEGHFVLQANGREGWIASSQTLFKVSSNLSDAVYPNNSQAAGVR